MKRFISGVLVFAMLFGCLGLSGAAANPAEKIPTVYVVGGNQVMRDPETGEQKWGVTVPDGYIEDAVKDCIGDLLKALVTGRDRDIEAYQTKLLSWIEPLYAEVRCDENGVPLKELTVCRDYYLDRPFSLDDSLDDRICNGYYPIRAYDFYYDWRADLFLAADQLEQYIDMVREATGSSVVNVAGRCEGASLILAYLSRYGSGKLSRLLFYTPTSEEYMLVSQSYAGKIRFSFPEISAWVNNNRYFSLDSLSTEKVLTELLKAMLRAAAQSPTGLSGAALNLAYERVFKSVLPDVLLASYATMPATWSMVSKEDYEDALAYVFNGKETEYAGLIERIRNYHDNAGAISERLLREAAANGVHIGVITKYGYPAIPLFEESDQLSDGSSILHYTSFGATASKHSETLSDRYIADLAEKGLSGYLSPDKKIDASTCLFPDATWFIGGIDHEYFPASLDLFLEQFMRAEAPMTVRSVADRPQFLLFENDGLVPLTDENADRATVGVQEPSAAKKAADRLLRLFSAIRDMLIRFFGALFPGLSGDV